MARRDMPEGSWSDTARNARLEGGVLSCDLQRMDGEWVPASVDLESLRLANFDGVFVPQDSLQSCLHTAGFIVDVSRPVAGQRPQPAPAPAGAPGVQQDNTGKDTATTIATIAAIGSAIAAAF